MNFKPARLLLALIALAVTPAFAQNVAVVNGKAIPTSRLNDIVKMLVAQGQGADNAEMRASVKEQLIEHEVLMQEAVKQGYDKKPEVKQEIQSSRDQIVLSALAREYIQKHPVTDSDVKAEYERQIKKAGDKEYHIRHILLENEADARAVIAKLKAGAKFEDLAKTQSKDSGTANTGGDLDWATPGQVPPEFAAGFANLQKGQVAENPIKTNAGYHVIKVDDVRALKLPTLEEAKQQLMEGLAQQKLAAFQDEVRKKAKVQQ